jgi:hypothetical protein
MGGMRRALLLAAVVVVAAVTAVLALVLPTTPTPHADASRVIPHTLAWRAQEDCLTAVGIGPEPGHSWTVIGDRIDVYDADGGVIASFADDPGLTGCLEAVPYDEVVSPPSDLVSRLLLADYSRHVLWPCLVNEGFDPGPPPVAADFATVQTARDVDPFAGYWTVNFSTDTLLELAGDCPVQPSYLAAG